jgi:hypothetical protein
MKIVALTGGAGPMYCGSCIRDNALAAEIKSRGHDFTLLPIYTPTLTDETNVSEDKVFCGGISVYLEQHWALFRKTPSLLDSLWDSPWALKFASRRSIPVNPRLLGELTISMLRGDDGFQRKEIQKLTSWLRNQAPPDIVTLPNSLLIGLARPIKGAVGAAGGRFVSRPASGAVPNQVIGSNSGQDRARGRFRGGQRILRGVYVSLPWHP